MEGYVREMELHTEKITESLQDPPPPLLRSKRRGINIQK